MDNKCKKKGCTNETLNERKYCNYHQSKKEDRKRAIVNGVLTIGGVMLTAVLKKNSGGSGKS
ncbi:hypothetical protein [Clostridium tunisiense]|uniref:hypothetical protein n=1 Tax=Clostridium tunisiense TaxID=219748 RepID=UPI0002D763C0|nr:hypothetical protein [Clostridium tunisiense]